MNQVSEQSLHQRLEHIVGEKYILGHQDHLDPYCRDTIPFEKNCRFVVLPASAEEVAEIVRTASNFDIPIWAYSTGKNWGYGATIAARDGAIIMILQRMNRILEVDEELGYAVIEPGVTQDQLNQHLKETGSRLWMDATDSTPKASVLGNALERGVGYTSYGDHYGAICGLEVVLADGTTVRTSAGPENLKTRYTYKYGTGPIVEGLFSQSNLGIVTRGGIALMPRPEDHCCFFVKVKSEDSLPEVLVAMRELVLNGIVNSNIHTINEYFIAVLMEPFPKGENRSSTALTEAEIISLRKRYLITPWNVSGAVYGTKAQVRASLREVRKRLGHYGTLFTLNQWQSDLVHRVRKLVAKSPRLCHKLHGPLRVVDAIQEFYPVFKGEPIELVVRAFEYYKAPVPPPESDIDPSRDGNATGLIWFPPLSPLKPDNIREVMDICRPEFERFGFNYSAAIVMVNPRTVIVLAQIFFDKSDAEETGRAKALHSIIMEKCLAAGYQQYRTSVAHMETILDSNPEYANLLQGIKSAVDPTNLLAPGRYGVVTKSGN
ncbi:MAG: FAD-binding oxidoreductase [Verrucomicrobiales bacterium]|nr:FAD-binding oxidoreductase [Verrucomicrobiales bacterium]